MPTFTVEAPPFASSDILQAREAALRLSAGETNLDLTPTIARVVSQLLEKIATGSSKPVSVGTIAAAKHLNVSRPYLVGLLKSGKIDHYMVGSHHRVNVKDLDAYKLQQGKTSQAALQQLYNITNELGLYDVDPRPEHG